MLSFVLGGDHLTNEPTEFINKLKTNRFEAVQSSINQSYLNGLRVGIISDYTDQPIIQALNYAMRALDINNTIVRFPLESITQMLIDESSELYRANLDLLIIYPDYMKQYRKKITIQKQDMDFTEIQHLRQLTKKFQTITKSKIILTSAPISKEESHRAYLASANQIIREIFAPDISILKIDFHTLADQDWFDQRMLENFRIPFSPHNISLVTGSFIAALRTCLGNPIKIIISDLDGTLWDRILAEEENEKFKEYLEALAPSKKVLALELKKQYQKGMVLAIATKNDPELVDAVLQNLEKFPLNKENFYMIEANWGQKSKSINQILRTIGFSAENALFIDDSPLECIEAKLNTPGLQVIHIENTESLMVNCFEEAGLFAGKDKVTFEDFERNRSYEITRTINEIRNDSTLRDYLLGLGQTLSLLAPTTEDYPRINQMHERTNQFRSNLKNFSPSQKNYSKQAVLRLKDKYLDYGIVGFVEWRVIADELFIQQWMMSCRVFNRGLHQFTLMELLKIENLTTDNALCVYFEDSGKNSHLYSILLKLGLVYEKPYFRGIPNFEE